MEASARNGFYKLLGGLVKIYLQLHGCKVGKNFRCIGFPVFRCVPKSNITIGNNVSFGYGVILEITPEGRLQLDDYALIGDYCTLSSMHSIHIKQWSAVAERASLRDGFHKMGRDEKYRKQPSHGAPIILEEDTGIGAGTVVLMGVHLPKGAFVGANSVVSRKDELEEFAIYAGNPLTKVKDRS